MNLPTPNETPHRSRPRWFRIAVASLAISLAVLAVAAKTLHYSPHSAEARYFSSSVKIVKAGSKEFGCAAPIAIVAVAAPPVVLRAPEQNDFTPLFIPDAPDARDAFLLRHQLRGPPSLN